jgi:GT2 family glycosyltransferase
LTSSSASNRACPLSVVVVSHNEGGNLLSTVESLLASLPPGGEIVVVDDCSTDASADHLIGYYGVTVLRPPERLGVARSRNYGARQTTGAVVVFSDAHMQVPWNWWAAVQAALADPQTGAASPAVSIMHKREVKGYGLRWCGSAMDTEWLPRQGSTPYPVPVLPGCFLAMRRDAFERTGGFDSGLDEWGMNDVEISLRLWTLGYECRIVPSVDVAHLFRSAHIYPVKWEVVLHNMLRVAVVHFNEERTRLLTAAISGKQAFPGAFARLLAGDAWSRRQEIRAARLHDDAWFFKKFEMEYL